MKNFLTFITHHWALWGALVSVIILLIIEETRKIVQGVAKIPANKAVDLINREDAVVIDIREANKFNDGHIIGSINIANSEIENNINKLTKYKDKPIIVVCNLGQSAIKAGSRLKKHGFTKVFSISGGIAEWQKSNLPLVKN